MMEMKWGFNSPALINIGGNEIVGGQLVNRCQNSLAFPLKSKNIWALFEFGLLACFSAGRFLPSVLASLCLEETFTIVGISSSRFC